MGITNPDVYYTFDLQKSLSHPKLSIFIAYQKCDTLVLNVGLHNFGSGHVHTYICKDTIAFTSSQEAAS